MSKRRSRKSKISKYKNRSRHHRTQHDAIAAYLPDDLTNLVTDYVPIRMKKVENVEHGKVSKGKMIGSEKHGKWTITDKDTQRLLSEQWYDIGSLLKEKVHFPDGRVLQKIYRHGTLVDAEWLD